LLYKAANVGRGVKITNSKGNGLVLKIAAQKNTHSKLKNGQHAGTAINAALACFSFYKCFTHAKQQQRSGK
jgi:transcriptional regulator of met regulon